MNKTEEFMYNILNNWMRSLDNEIKQKMINCNCVLAGGFFKSMFLGEPPKDFDIYSGIPGRNLDEIRAAIVYSKDFAVSKNAVNINTEFQGETFETQFIKEPHFIRHDKIPEDMEAKMDMVHCMVGIKISDLISILKSGSLSIDCFEFSNMAVALGSIASKEIYVNHKKKFTPLEATSTSIRIIRLILKGWEVVDISELKEALARVATY